MRPRVAPGLAVPDCPPLREAAAWPARCLQHGARVVYEAARGLRRTRRGSATLEFAIAAPVLLFLLGFMVDFTMLLRARVAISTGLMSAVQYAVTTGPTVTSANLRTVLQQATPINGLTANVSGPGCYCASAYPVTLTAASCGSTCPSDGSTAGTYVILSGSYGYTPMMPGVSRMMATTVTLTATARLQ